MIARSPILFRYGHIMCGMRSKVNRPGYFDRQRDGIEVADLADRVPGNPGAGGATECVLWCLYGVGPSTTSTEDHPQRARPYQQQTARRLRGQPPQPRVLPGREHRHQGHT